MTKSLYERILDIMTEANAAGYAICVFTPEELRGAPAHKVEERMCELAWDYIDWLTDTEAQDELA